MTASNAHGTIPHSALAEWTVPQSIGPDVDALVAPLLTRRRRPWFVKGMMAAASRSETGRVVLTWSENHRGPAWYEAEGFDPSASAAFRISEDEAETLVDAGLFAYDGECGEDEARLVAMDSMVRAVLNERISGSSSGPILRGILSGYTSITTSEQATPGGVILDEGEEPLFLPSHDLEDELRYFDRRATSVLPATSFADAIWAVPQRDRIVLPISSQPLPARRNISDSKCIPSPWNDLLHAPEDLLRRTALAVDAMDAILEIKGRFDASPWMI